MAWPNIKPSKSTKVFSSLIPIAASSVAEGLLYDNSILGLGLKWGLAIGIALFAVFFGGLTLVILDSKSVSY